MESIPLIGDIAARALNQRADEALHDNPVSDPNITVAIRAYNEAPKLELLLQDVAAQVVSSEVEIVVVDNESTDHTRDVAREYGATVVTLPRDEFTYPRSMNLGMEAASHDTVFLTVGHAQLSTDQTLHGGARHFRSGSNVGGAFSIAMPSSSASCADRVLQGVSTVELLRQPRRIKRAGMGVLAATGAMVSKEIWQELGCFDGRYESGGEDTALARKMLASGYGVIKEPTLAVHHAHGHGLIAIAKELWHVNKTLQEPQPFHGKVATRRQARFEEK